MTVGGVLLEFSGYVIKTESSAHYFSLLTAGTMQPLLGLRLLHSDVTKNDNNVVHSYCLVGTIWGDPTPIEHCASSWWAPLAHEGQASIGSPYQTQLRQSQNMDTTGDPNQFSWSIAHGTNAACSISVHYRLTKNMWFTTVGVKATFDCGNMIELNI